MTGFVLLLKTALSRWNLDCFLPALAVPWQFPGSSLEVPWKFPLQFRSKSIICRPLYRGILCEDSPGRATLWQGAADQPDCFTPKNACRNRYALLIQNLAMRPHLHLDLKCISPQFQKKGNVQIKFASNKMRPFRHRNDSGKPKDGSILLQFSFVYSSGKSTLKLRVST